MKGWVCITHGATKKRKRCSHKGCTNHVVNGGVCITHGAQKQNSRDVQTKPKWAEFVSHMEPRPRYIGTATGDVPPMSEKEEFVTNIA